MRTRLLVSALAVALIGAAGVAQEDAKEFKPAKGGFSVMMPGTPKSQESDGVVIYTLQKDPLIFVVGYGDYDPNLVKQKGADAVLNADRDSFVKSVSGKIESQKKETLEGNPGLNVRITTPNGAHFLLREFLVGKRLFQVVTGGPKSAVDSEPSKRFHASFKLVK